MSDAEADRRWTRRTQLSAPMAFSLREERIEPNAKSLDDWRPFLGKGYHARLSAKLDWKLCQREFYICAHCGRLYEQSDRPSTTYDDCWDCAVADRRDDWVRTWLAVLWAQIVGSA